MLLRGQRSPIYADVNGFRVDLGAELSDDLTIDRYTPGADDVLGRPS